MRKIQILFCVLLFVIFASCESRNVELYLSPEGQDTNKGTFESPLRTLQAAKDRLDVLTSKNTLSATLYLRGGVYPMDSAIVFANYNALTIKAYGDEEPILDGGKKISNWRLLSDSVMLARLDKKLQGKIYVADVKDAGVIDFGDPTKVGCRPDLYCDDSLQILARWPNEGFAISGRAKGKTPVKENYLKRPGFKEGIFEYTDPYIDRWLQEKDPRLSGYWFWDWSDGYQMIDEIDTSTRTITLKEPYHHFGYRDNLRFYGLNIFCEMDVPQEWYLDRETGLLYWFPPEGIDLAGSNVVLSTLNSPYMIELRDCTNVSIEGLTLLQGRGSGILIEGGEDNKIESCRIQRFGRDGVNVIGGFNNTVSGCYISDLGYSGIKISGGDRKTLTPSGHVVDNNIVERFSQFKKTYEPAVLMDGCGIRVAHNRFSNSTSSAIRLEGNDHLLEYNQIDHVVNESDDQGGLDSYYNPSYRGNIIRYNHWSDIRGGTYHGSAGVRLDDMISGMQIYGNLFERCGILKFGAVQINGGKDNVVQNNIFFDCPAIVSFIIWPKEKWMEHLHSDAIQKKLYEDVNINDSVYLKKYPELKNLEVDTDINTIKDNLVIDCGSLFIKINDRQIVESNTQLKSGGKGIGDFCSAEILKSYGLQPIAFDSIGPLNNKWMK